MNQKKFNKIVLFDIDHTIFDTILYRNNLYKNLAKEFNADVNEFSEIAQNEYIKLRKTTYYLDPDVFLNTILTHSEKKIDHQKLKVIFWDKKLYEKSIYPDVKNVFSYLAKNNIQIGIFSTGESTHQKIKIESLNEYLTENHIYISKDKFKIIKKTFAKYKNHQVYLVDDYPQILESTKFHHKNIFTVFIKRQKAHSNLVIPENFKPDASITNLNQLIDIIETNN